LAKNPIVQQILAIGRRRNAKPAEIKAALETGRVESNFTNPSGGDADSAGWRQERASLYPNPTNVRASINRFYDEAAKFDHGQPSYEIAADVQRPAAKYRGRYRTASGEAQALLGGAGTTGPSTPMKATSVPNPATPDTGATNPASARRAALQNYILTEHSDPNALLSLAFNLNTAANTATVHGTPAPPTTVRAGLANRRQTAAGSAPGGVVDFEGHKVAGWIAPVLQYARKNGWKGTVTSGFRTDAEQTRIYDSGVRPAAVPKSEGGSGSNHEGSRFPLGAVDVSDAQQLSQILQKSPYASKLQYAGAKDPVHFSHPHGGGY
jgi:hypothetical protein